ncbi:MAG: hypothetical protein WAL48_00150 [Xanthobacteraceae bacterium]
MSLLNEYSALVIAAVLILASVPIVFAFDRTRIIDHLARSLVAIGVGLMAAFVAVTIFDLNAQRLENERNLGQQQVKRSKMLTLVSNLRYFAIQYGFAAYQIHETRADCAPKGPDTAMSEACREGANYAINVSKLIPQDYTLITSLSEASNAFAKSVRVSTLLADAEVTTRARMPVVIENYIGAFATGSQPPSQVRDRFLQTLSELENVAEDASVAFCIFAAALGQSEAKLEQTISTLEGALAKEQQPTGDVVQSSAKNVNMGDFDCANPRAQIERNLSVASGTR